jgi:FkbM family methyltransferase
LSSFLKTFGAERLSRIPARLRDDARIVSLTRNWTEILAAKVNGKPISRVVFRNGAVFESPPEIDLLFLFHEIWLERVYDRKGYEIRPGDKVIDIGGNIGAFAVFAGSSASNVSINTYEPFPQNVKYLKKNIEASKLSGINIFQAAVAGEDGERFLKVDDSWVRHSLSDGAEEGRGIKVETITLDRILGEMGKCNFLKVDCEGGEYDIFYNAKPETLRKIDRIVCEYHDVAGGTGEELKSFFEKNSFRVDLFKAFDETTGVLFLTNQR